LSTAASPAGNAIVVTFFVLGHILGAALRGSIATVGWLAMLLTTPMHVLAFVVLQMPALDIAAWLLMSLAFVCCAVKIVKTPNDQWDLPTLGQTPQKPPRAAARRA
jgi:hypothetical protein